LKLIFTVRIIIQLYNFFKKSIISEKERDGGKRKKEKERERDGGERGERERERERGGNK